MSNNLIKVVVTETKRVKEETYGVYDLNIEQGSLATTTYEYSLWLSTSIALKNVALVTELSKVLNTISKLANMPEEWVDLSEYSNQIDPKRTAKVISLLSSYIDGYTLVEAEDVAGLQHIILPDVIAINVHSRYSNDYVPLADTVTTDGPVSIRYEFKQINHLTFSNLLIGSSKLYSIIKSSGLTENVIESYILTDPTDSAQQTKASRILQRKRPTEYNLQLTAKIVKMFSAEDRNNIYVESENPQCYEAVIVPETSPNLMGRLFGRKTIPEHVELRLFKTHDLNF